MFSFEKGKESVDTPALDFGPQLWVLPTGVRESVSLVSEHNFWLSRFFQVAIGGNSQAQSFSGACYSLLEFEILPRKHTYVDFRRVAWPDTLWAQSPCAGQQFQIPLVQIIHVGRQSTACMQEVDSWPLQKWLDFASKFAGACEKSG